MRLTICTALAALAGATTLVGCQTGPRMGGLNPFYRPDRTTMTLPAERIEAIRATANRSTGADTPEQRAIVQELVAPLATENDPLVREAILQTVAAFNTPLASKALLAGLTDADPNVRVATCKLIAENPSPAAPPALSAIVQGDESFDVRIAAARALGSAGASKEQLLPVLEDPNPAMQLVGVEAMRRLTGRDLGGDVTAYRALARGETPQIAEPRGRTSVANRLPEWVPFF